jgi:hypothetical protein
VFGVTGVVVDAACRPRWYQVQLPIRPNGALGYVRAPRLELAHVETRIVIDVSARELTVYRGGRRVLSATVAVGSPGTPTPLGHFYVNQRLIPENARGPFGPAAIGIFVLERAHGLDAGRTGRSPARAGRGRRPRRRTAVSGCRT